jgi:UDP-N-acetylmuramoylalanine-D-glutamate ligase
MHAAKHILLFGAGKSATVLIDYLKEIAANRHWKVTVADASLARRGRKPAGLNG